MEASLKMLRTVRIAMLISIVLYVLVGERTAHPAKLANLVVYYAMTLMVVAMVATMFLVRRVRVIRAEQTLAQKPEDRVSLNRWRAGYIATYAVCEAIALYGLVLRFLSFSLAQVMPFYVAGFVLLVFFRPRRASNELG